MGIWRGLTWTMCVRERWWPRGRDGDQAGVKFVGEAFDERVLRSDLLERYVLCC